MEPILPGATLGILGGGQLGRMSILAGRHLGYRFHVYEPGTPGSASMVADAHSSAGYDDQAALETFAQSIAAVTLEFENIPFDSASALAAKVPVRPGPKVLRICQNRRREKLFLREHGFPCADFRVVTGPEELREAVAELGTPCVLKTADFGYDGKGQLKIESPDIDYAEVWKEIGYSIGVVEAWVSFEAECSVIVARNGWGQSVTFPVAENIHRNHILHQSIVPARLPESVQKDACALAMAVAESIDCIGLLAVELFVKQDGSVLVNELAPRPHNSGHWSLDGAATSQFEQHIRAVCGLPLGDSSALCPSVMVNLLGDVWKDGQAPDWSRLLADRGVHLHLYDKGEPRPGRKMGHFTVLKPTIEEALATAERLFAGLL